MAPHRRISWRSLIVGLAAIASLTAVAVWVLLFARVGALHGDRYRLHLLTGDASRVAQGTEVWLAGRKVGLVSAVRLRPVSVDTMRRVSVELEILQVYQPEIRSDSRAHIGHAGTPLGAPVVMLGEGAPGARMLVDGDSILAQPRTSPRELVARIASASGQLPRLAANVHAIADAMNRTASRVEQLPSAHAAGIRSLLKRTSARITTLGRRVDLPRTRAGRTARPDGRSDGVSTHATRLAARVDSIAAVAVAGRGTVARLRQDTVFAATLDDIDRRIISIGTLLSQRRGSARRFGNDRAGAH